MMRDRIAKRPRCAGALRCANRMRCVPHCMVSITGSASFDSRQIRCGVEQLQLLGRFIVLSVRLLDCDASRHLRCSRHARMTREPIRTPISVCDTTVFNWVLCRPPVPHDVRHRVELGQQVPRGRCGVPCLVEALSTVPPLRGRASLHAHIVSDRSPAASCLLQIESSTYIALAEALNAALNDVLPTESSTYACPGVSGVVWFVPHARTCHTDQSSVPSAPRPDHFLISARMPLGVESCAERTRVVSGDDGRMLRPCHGSHRASERSKQRAHDAARCRCDGDSACAEATDATRSRGSARCAAFGLLLLRRSSVH